MNRRGFLKSIGAAVVGVALSRALPGIAPAAPTLAPPPVVGDGPLLQRGDIFTVEGEFARHPLTGAFTGHLQRFVVTRDVTSERVPIDYWPQVAQRDLIFADDVTPTLVGHTLPVEVEWQS